MNFRQLMYASNGRSAMGRKIKTFFYYGSTLWTTIIRKWYPSLKRLTVEDRSLILNLCQRYFNNQSKDWKSGKQNRQNIIGRSLTFWANFFLCFCSWMRMVSLQMKTLVKMIWKIAIEYTYSIKSFEYKFKTFHNISNYFLILFCITFGFIDFLVKEISSCFLISSWNGNNLFIFSSVKHWRVR